MPRALTPEFPELSKRRALLVDSARRDMRCPAGVKVTRLSHAEVRRLLGYLPGHGGRAGREVR